MNQIKSDKLFCLCPVNVLKTHQTIWGAVRTALSNNGSGPAQTGRHWNHLFLYLEFPGQLVEKKKWKETVKWSSVTTKSIFKKKFTKLLIYWLQYFCICLLEEICKILRPEGNNVHLFIWEYINLHEFRK